MSLFADVALPLPLYKTFLYVIPDNLALQAEPGCRAAVPFRGRLQIGYIVRIRDSVPEVRFKCKPISNLIDTTPLFSAGYLEFIIRLSDAFYSSSGELLHASLPSAFQVKVKSKLLLTGKGRNAMQEKKASGQELTALRLLESRPYSVNYFAKKIGENGRTVVSALEKKQWIEEEKRIAAGEEKPLPVDHSPVQIEMAFSRPDAAVWARSIAEALKKRHFSPFLLKAAQAEREDIYFTLIRETLARSQTVLFMQPEIDLTHRFREKWERRLGENMVILHSRVSEAERKISWMKIQARQARVVAGPRSALLAPIPDLGLIILDEEQDDFYYQEESPVYDARKGARIRAETEKAVLVYGSESPRVESMLRAEEGKYLLTVPKEPGKPRVRVQVVEHQAERSLLHPETKTMLEKEVGKDRQALIFTNRRGYAAFVFCRRCRYIPRCENCDIPLMISRKEGRMVCRYCRYTQPALQNCPQCGSRLMRGKGWGVETAAETVRRLLPGKTVAGFFSDAFKKREEKETCLKQYLEGKIDVLVGTRMLSRYIPPLSAPLVVVLFPETILSLPDFRAGQRTYEYLSSLKKLAAPAGHPAFVVQTGYSRHHAVAGAVEDDYVSFFEEEIHYRRLLNYPPFTIMAEIIFQDRSARAAARQARDFSRLAAASLPGVEVLGPSKAPLARLRGKHRIQMLLKSPSRRDLDQIFSAEMAPLLSRASIRVYE
jgi:primosomal protein N' (replication factor Y) (superfamily II helicase)